MKKLIFKGIGLYFNIMTYFAKTYTTEKAFQVFCTPQRVKLTERQASFMDTAESIEMISDNLPNIRVYKWGSGSRKVLMLHGWQSQSFRWIKYIQALQADGGFTIYTLDAPAHGDSGGKVLNVFMYGDTLELFTAKYGQMDAYVGHSLGGFVLLRSFAHIEAYNAAKLVVMGAPGNVSDFINFYVDMIGGSKRLKQSLYDYMRENFIAAEDNTNLVYGPKIRAKGLIIHDVGDQDTSVEHAKKLSELWTNSSLELTEGLGHKLRDSKVVDMVVDFVKD